jgi:hypothetical protein
MRRLQKMEQVKAPCSSCVRETTHNILYAVQVTHEDDDQAAHGCPYRRSTDALQGSVDAKLAGPTSRATLPLARPEGVVRVRHKKWAENIQEPKTRF